MAAIVIKYEVDKSNDDHHNITTIMTRETLIFVPDVVSFCRTSRKNEDGKCTNK